MHTQMLEFKRSSRCRSTI